MSNNYGILEKEEKEIRERDKTCVYCHKVMKEWALKGSRIDMVTIEHISNYGPFNEKSNVAICCQRCNSSRKNKALLDWFKTPYCIGRNINEETVKNPDIKEYIQLEKFINRGHWKFAKTMAEIPHYYIVRDYLSENDKKLFDKFEIFVKKNGSAEKFFSKEYTYYRIGNYKYWFVENILNRAEVK